MSWDTYTKIFSILFALPLLSIPVITSRFFSLFFEIRYYFHDHWPIFILLGLVLTILGIKVGRLALAQNKIRGLAKGNYKLITTGIYSLMRHPLYSAWALVYIGLSFICDSLIAIILIPFVLIIFNIKSFLEEKLLLLPKFGDNYLLYKEEVENKLFPPPYNYVLIIIFILVGYIGGLNLELIVGI